MELFQQVVDTIHKLGREDFKLARDPPSSTGDVLIQLDQTCISSSHPISVLHLVPILRSHGQVRLGNCFSIVSAVGGHIQSTPADSWIV